MKTTRTPLSAPLPGRLRLLPDEPPYALLLRTAEHNGMFQPYTTFWRAGLTGGQAVTDLAVDRVAFLCQQTVEDVARAAPIVADGKHVGIGDETLYRDQVSVAHRRWCPACLEERPYHRVWWDVPTIAACPDHGLVIVETCGCRTRPLWRSTPLTGCLAGKHRFAQAPRTPAPAAEVALSAYLRDRLCGRPRAPMPLLDGLDLGEAIRVVERVGRASVSPDLAFSRSKENRGGLAAEGFRVMQDFGPRIDEVFDRLRAAAPTRDGVRQWGVEHAYGDFYIWIANYPDGSAFAEAIKKAVAAHAERNLVLKTGHRVAGVEVTPQEGVDMADAAAMWGVTFERFRRIAALVGLVPKSSIRGRPARLDPETVRLWADRLKGAKTRQEVAGELGIAPHAVARLIKAGLIPVVVDGKSDKESHLNLWLLPGDAAAQFLARLDAVARPVEDGEGLVPLSIAARMVRTPLPKLVRLALAGKLPLRRDPEESGLEAFLVRKGAAQVAERRARVPGMTITEAGKALKLHADVTAQLRDCGMLKTTKHGRIHSVSDDEVARFRADYVTTDELVSRFGLPPGRWTVAAMRKLGVEPACDRPKFRQVIYRRDEAEEALSRRPAPAPKPAVVPDALGLPDGIDAKGFARAVGIDPQMVPQLVAAGAIWPLVSGHRYVFTRDAPAVFRRSYANASEFSEAVGVNGRGVSTLLRKLGVQPTHDRPQFYSALYPRAEAEAAIARHLADEADKGRAVAAAEVAKADDGPRLTSRDACTFLGCTDVMLTQLRKAGLIDAGGHANALVYRKAELDRFKTRYVLGAELAGMVGRSGASGGKAMTQVVLGLGVTPVCARPDFYSFLFERAQVTEALKRWDGVTNKWLGKPGAFDSRRKAAAE